MKQKKEKLQSVQSIDERLQTENEHYNVYAQKVITECIRGQIFPDVETVLQLYGDCCDKLQCAETPLE